MEIELSRYLVIAVDAVRARFFRLRDNDTPEIETGPNLVEITSLLNPLCDMQDEEVFTETKTGAHGRNNKGQMHQYDDHRTRHTEEFAKRFGNEIIKQAMRQAAKKGTQDITLVANPQMLGLLRERLEDDAKGRSLNLHTISKDVSKLSPRRIHDLLSAQNLLPPCRAGGEQMGARRRKV